MLCMVSVLFRLDEKHVLSMVFVFSAVWKNYVVHGFCVLHLDGKYRASGLCVFT